jgi:hypothetical protein
LLLKHLVRYVLMYQWLNRASLPRLLLQIKVHRDGLFQESPGLRRGSVISRIRLQQPMA